MAKFEGITSQKDGEPASRDATNFNWFLLAGLIYNNYYLYNYIYNI